MENGDKSARTEDIKTIQAGTSQIQLVVNDRIVWTLTKPAVFPCKSAWEMIRVRRNWNGGNWFGIIPLSLNMHSFNG